MGRSLKSARWAIKNHTGLTRTIADVLGITLGNQTIADQAKETGVRQALGAVVFGLVGAFMIAKSEENR